ncbi:MAG: tetratricopeptide repeat protein [Terriglobales bacterium]
MPVELKQKPKKDLSRKGSAASARAKVHQMPSRRAADVRLSVWLSKRNLVICLLLAVATLALYSPVVRYPFVNYDDDVYVTRNGYVQSGLTWSTVEWAFASADASNWHPLTWLSHALDWQLFGSNSAGHHITSLLIHALNVALLFLLLFWATRRKKPSLLVAALFAVHPLNVQSVAWIAERKNVLCTLFFFAAIGAYGWYAQRPSWRRYLAVAGLFVAGLMSKPMVITLPFVLLLLDYWPLGRMPGSAPGRLPAQQRPLPKLVLEKLPLFLLCIASAVITMQVQSVGGAVRSTLKLSFGVRLENALVAYPMYLWQMIWPARLAVLYPHPGDTLKAWQLILSAALLVSISALVFSLRSRRYLLVGWLWFLGTLVPVIGLVQVGDAARADRYTYIPLIGIFVMIVFGAADVADALKLKMPLRVAPAVCVLLALGFATHQQMKYWSSSIELWSRTLSLTKNNLIAHRNMASALTEVGRVDEAYEQFKAEAALNPFDLLSQLAIGSYLYSHHQLPDALAQFDKMTHLTRDRQPLSAAYAGMGMTYSEMGDEIRARQSLEHSMRLNPNQPNAYHGLGRLAEKQGNSQEAIYDYSRLVDLAPSGQSYRLLGHAFQNANRPVEALEAYQDALKLSPEMKEELTPAINSLLAASGQNR